MSQTEKLYQVLSDYEPHNTIEIMELVYGNGHLGLARIGARIYDIQKRYGVKVTGWHDSRKRSIYWYQLELPFPVCDNNQVKMFA